MEFLNNKSRIKYLRKIKQKITDDNSEEKYKEAFEFLLELAKKIQTPSMEIEGCNSDIIIEWVLIQRKVGRIHSASSMLVLISGLKIHRPSFNLLARMITTYGTSAQCNESFTKDMKTISEKMQFKYKYHLNTYLLNYMLNTYNKLNDRESFWDLITQCLPENKTPVFDVYTFGSIFEMCIREENWIKMKIMKEKFMKVHHLFDKNNKNYSYVNHLYNKDIKLQQKRQKRDYLNWLHNTVYVQ
jgi:hypothetical protein